MPTQQVTVLDSDASSAISETTPLLTDGSGRSEQSSSDGDSTPIGPLISSVSDAHPLLASFWTQARNCIDFLLRALRPLHLENTGSVARDHLANERTFLAWLRTSLAFCSVGVALTQIFSLFRSPKSLPTPPGPDFTPLRSEGSKALAVNGAEDDLRHLLVLLDQAHRSYGALVERVGKVDPVQAERARKLARFAKPLGGGLIATGFLILVIGLLRYFSVQRALVKGAFPATRLPVLAVSTLSGAFVFCVFAAVLKV